MANRVIGILNNSNIRTNLDSSSNSFKEKVSKAKIQGVPLIALIGDKEVQSEAITIIRRDVNKEETSKLDHLNIVVEKLLQKNDLILRKWAYDNLKSTYTSCLSYNEIFPLAKDDKLIEVLLCEEEKCLLKLEDVDETEIVGSLVDVHLSKSQKCICCGKLAKQKILLGKKWKGEK